jgi:hypothetical protein
MEMQTEPPRSVNLRACARGGERRGEGASLVEPAVARARAREGLESQQGRRAHVRHEVVEALLKPAHVPDQPRSAVEIGRQRCGREDDALLGG